MAENKGTRAAHQNRENAWVQSWEWARKALLRHGEVCQLGLFGGGSLLSCLTRMLGSQILNTPRQWSSQEGPEPLPTLFWVLGWPCAYWPDDQATDERKGSLVALGVPCRCQGQSGTRQAQLKAFSSLFSLLLLKCLTKGLAFNPQGPCCTGNKIHLLLRSQASLAGPSFGSTVFPKCLPFWPYQ